MKSLQILSSFVLLNCCFSISAQKTFEAEFENGLTNKMTILYDDPDMLSKWRIGLSLFGYNRVEKQNLSLFTKMEYRANSDLYFEGMYSFALPVPLDGSEPKKNLDKRFKSTSNMNVLGHYFLFKKNNTMERSFKIASMKNDKDQMTNYFVSVPRTVKNAMLLDFGISSFTQNSNVLLNKTSQADLGRYFIPTHNSASVQLGFSYYRAQSIRLNSSYGGQMKFLRCHRFYANALYGVINRGKVYYIKQNGDDGGEVQSGFEDPIKNNLGFVCGLTSHFGLRTSTHASWFSFQYGFLPNISVAQDEVASFNRASQTSFYTIALGLSFGSKKQIADKQP